MPLWQWWWCTGAQEEWSACTWRTCEPHSRWHTYYWCGENLWWRPLPCQPTWWMAHRWVAASLPDGLALNCFSCKWCTLTRSPESPSVLLSRGSRGADDAGSWRCPHGPSCGWPLALLGGMETPAEHRSCRPPHYKKYDILWHSIFVIKVVFMS
jgi:hypothetical protein